MTYRKIRLWGAFFRGSVLGILFGAGSSWAQVSDPGLIRALNTDSAPIENTYYLETSFDNDFSRRHWIYFYGEGLFSVAKEWGVEVDFPNLSTRHPLGQFSLAFEPIGLFVRYEFWHFGNWNDETAGAFSLSAGGFYGGAPLDQSARGGSSLALEALGGYRLGRFFLQGEYAFQGAVDPNSSSQWNANTALGYRLTNEWHVQMEADLTASLPPFNETSWSFVPQIAFQPGDWLFEFGEAFTDPSSVFTEVMVARAL